jgi:hypothetical protein
MGEKILGDAAISDKTDPDHVFSKATAGRGRRERKDRRNEG